MATSDLVKHRRGLLSNLEILDDGRIGVVEDVGNERLVFGTVNGNIFVPNQSDLNDLQVQVSGIADTANQATSNIAQAILTANNAIGVANTTNSNHAILVGKQTYTATASGTINIPIPSSITIDLTSCNMDIFHNGSLVDDTTYIIDAVNRQITLDGWSLNNTEKIQYRIYV